jgi:hypothetical protein
VRSRGSIVPLPQIPALPSQLVLGIFWRPTIKRLARANSVRSTGALALRIRESYRQFSYIMGSSGAAAGSDRAREGGSQGASENGLRIVVDFFDASDWKGKLARKGEGRR